MSLDAVEEWSATFPDKVTKSHLSPTENGFMIGDPGARYPVETWDVGFDNPRLHVGKNRGTGPTLTEIERTR